MNENIDLTKILKDCPEGTMLWSDDYGKVRFLGVEIRCERPIVVRRTDGYTAFYTEEGWHDPCFPANCLLWPSKDCRDWSKFTAPWHKKERFDPKTLKAFDRVLTRTDSKCTWGPDFFGYIDFDEIICTATGYVQCICYNDETKHLIGTMDEAPEFYRYWEE